MSSNPAHCLATGLLDGERGAALADRLLADDMFTGWGMRTLSAKERRYNPMSYHNGSVWPHDNALAAVGLARVGRRDGAARILKGLLDAAVHLRRGSLPELFCGFPREKQLGPVPYPVACHPQAWSAASVFLILQAILGMRITGGDRCVTLEAPTIPSWLESLRIDKLKVADKTVSLMVRPTANGATVELVEKDKPVRLQVKN
jgi:glycogen debranching enzyme